jgi:pyridoxal phosphate-dependent aminotransferase EpsN
MVMTLDANRAAPPKHTPILAPPAKAPARILLSVPHMGGTELAHVQAAFASNWLSTVGPNLASLEETFAELVGRSCVALSSGTAGLHLALRLVGVRPGDEVVTPTLTFAASANPIRYEHARPVFLDSERATWNSDPELLSDFLARRARDNRLPKAVLVVHLFGMSADLDAFAEVCRHYELPLIEDAAESLGALYKGRHPGTIGAVGVFSFNGNKIITGTTGGMLVAANAEMTERARKWSQQARDADPLGVNNYVHSELGYNYRMSNVIAGIVRGQLEVLPTRVEQRRAVYCRYAQAFADLPGFEPQPEPPHCRHSRWLSAFLVDEAEFGLSAVELIHYLHAANVEARPVWRPMHTQPLYQGCECVGGAVAEDLHRRGICLPSSSSLSEANQAFVIERVREASAKATRRYSLC